MEIERGVIRGWRSANGSSRGQGARCLLRKPFNGSELVATLKAIPQPSRLNGNTQGLATWESTIVTGAHGSSVTITSVPARHGPIGVEPITGEVTGFVISMIDMKAIYISGDTIWFPPAAEVFRRFDVGLAVLFCGGAQPRGPFDVTMNTNDTPEAAAAFPGAKIVTAHNQGWSHYRQNQDDSVATFQKFGLGDRLEKLSPGKTQIVVL